MRIISWVLSTINWLYTHDYFISEQRREGIIGRVIVKEAYRGLGLGYEFMEESERWCLQMHSCLQKSPWAPALIYSRSTIGWVTSFMAMNMMKMGFHTYQCGNLFHENFLRLNKSDRYTVDLGKWSTKCQHYFQSKIVKIFSVYCHIYGWFVPTLWISEQLSEWIPTRHLTSTDWVIEAGTPNTSWDLVTTDGELTIETKEDTPVRRRYQ